MKSNILVVGSLAYDDVQTPAEHRTDVLGGAASYFAIAARLYAPVRLVGVIGDDFPRRTSSDCARGESTSPASSVGRVALSAGSGATTTR